MIKFALILLCLNVGLCQYLFSQDDGDTVYLAEIKVTGLQNDHYQLGGEAVELVSSRPAASLSQLVAEQSAVFLIQYGGKGQLSTINIRGLGGSRTNLTWNGMEINSFTLGQADYSLINGAAGNITLQKGSSSALFGNGAIGGAVDIASQDRFKQGHQLELSQGFGSFGDVNTRLKYQFASKKWAFVSSVYQQRVENDFIYRLRGVEVKQPNAFYRNWGLTQDVSYWVNADNRIAFSLWYNDNFREIQPTKGDLTNDDQLADDNLRMMLRWVKSKRDVSTQLKIGHSIDNQRFNTNSNIGTRRTFLGWEWSRSYGESLSLRTGFASNYIKAFSRSFEGVPEELRTDLFASLRWSPSRKTIVALSMREPIINRSLQPFSPMLSGRYFLTKATDTQLSIDAQVSRSYRIPTFNDRYWNPGGNRDLLPELSRNLEGGVSYYRKGEGGTVLDVKGRYFVHNVDNWIIWRPGGSDIDESGNPITFWFPDNIRKVLAQGAEIDLTFHLPISASRQTLKLQYASSYTDARNKLVISRFDRSQDKQLPYTPRFVHNLIVSSSWKGWKLQVHNRVVGERFTESNNELPPLPAYLLVNADLSKQWTAGQLRYSLHFAVNNIGNTDYENFINRAMPLRNFEITLNANYQFKNQ
ncbi:MAG: TonB-dependent receptor plug domain-containing protein [Bacteroidota bacterium]